MPPGGVAAAVAAAAGHAGHAAAAGHGAAAAAGHAGHGAAAGIAVMQPPPGFPALPAAAAPGGGGHAGGIVFVAVGGVPPPGMPGRPRLLPSLEQLTALRALNLSHNRFRRVPPVLAGLTRLEFLDLSHNPELQVGLYRTWLQEKNKRLDISFNRVKKVELDPVPFSTLPKSRNLQTLA